MPKPASWQRTAPRLYCAPMLAPGPGFRPIVLPPHLCCSTSIGNRSSARRRRASCTVFSRSTAKSRQGAGNSRTSCHAATSSRVAGRSACPVRRICVACRCAYHHNMLARCHLLEHVGTSRIWLTTRRLVSSTSGTRAARCSSSRALSRSMIAAASASCGQGSTTRGSTCTR